MVESKPAEIPIVDKNNVVNHDSAKKKEKKEIEGSKKENEKSGFESKTKEKNEYKGIEKEKNIKEGDKENLINTLLEQLKGIPEEKVVEGEILITCKFKYITIIIIII